MDDWVTIIHPETGGTGEVHRSSLPQHYAAGWLLLADGEAPQPEPGPASKTQAAKPAKKAAKAESEEN